MLGLPGGKRNSLPVKIGGEFDTIMLDKYTVNV